MTMEEGKCIFFLYDMTTIGWKCGTRATDLSRHSCQFLANAVLGNSHRT